MDWARRLDHMQQHTGQHVLSAAFVRLFEIPTVSFHLGTELSTIDLDRHARRRGHRSGGRRGQSGGVGEPARVDCGLSAPTRPRTLPLRKEPVRGGTLRLVEVEDFDLSACGGTHVTRTGAIGIIAVQALGALQGRHARLVCLRRPRARQFRASRDVVASAVRQLSIQPAELPDAVARLQGESRELRQQARALAEQLATYEAEGLARGAEDVGGTRVVCRVVEGRDAAGLKSLAQAIVARPGHVVALVGGSRPVVVVVARSADATLMLRRS